jgi:hypothetical protein
MAAPKPQNRNRTATASVPASRTEDEIRQRAYQLYEERGRQDGHALDDWLRAEAEITRNKTRVHLA